MEEGKKVAMDSLSGEGPLSNREDRRKVAAF